MRLGALEDRTLTMDGPDAATAAFTERVTGGLNECGHPSSSIHADFRSHDLPILHLCEASPHVKHQTEEEMCELEGQGEQSSQRYLPTGRLDETEHPPDKSHRPPGPHNLSGVNFLKQSRCPLVVNEPRSGLFLASSASH
jgi:hypothetical protein